MRVDCLIAEGRQKKTRRTGWVPPQGSDENWWRANRYHHHYHHYHHHHYHSYYHSHQLKTAGSEERSAHAQSSWPTRRCIVAPLSEEQARSCPVVALRSRAETHGMPTGFSTLRSRHDSAREQKTGATPPDAAKSQSFKMGFYTIEGAIEP